MRAASAEVPVPEPTLAAMFGEAVSVAVNDANGSEWDESRLKEIRGLMEPNVLVIQLGIQGTTLYYLE